MKEPAKQSIPLPYSEVEALQPFFQQLQDQYQLFMNHHQQLQYRYRSLVEHHSLLEKLNDVLLNHRYRLEDQTQVLEDYHQALEEDARMWQDYVQTLREHLYAMENLSPDSTQQGGSHESAQVHEQSSPDVSRGSSLCGTYDR